ncbi:hypothetical protein P4O66_007196 [Electrophorus voltai]|uniref:Uncharacterized protein n=1 Tax=Electrophorus voltai TaxID=2609070 RepID=A0AAD9DXC6_9TELE|nr:uncharacterized protein LOC113578837 isoform X2 [Electrophorus electricus]KAK1798930.1 hypothetical protein P4O66_007196 [Electrophorus voltai]
MKLKPTQMQHPEDHKGDQYSLQEVKDVSDLSESLCCDGDQQTLQTSLKTCSVQLVRCRKIRGPNTKIVTRGNLQDCDSGKRNRPSTDDENDGVKHPLHTTLKMCTVRLEDCRNILSKQTAGAEQENSTWTDYEHNSKDCISSNFVQTALKTCSVQLVHCRKIWDPNTKIVTQGNLHDCDSGKCNRSSTDDENDGVKHPLHTTLKMCTVRLEDCRNILSRQTAGGEQENSTWTDYEHNSKDCIFSSKRSRLSPDDENDCVKNPLHPTLKMRTVRLVTSKTHQKRKCQSMF